ncbi:hypothetical protein [Streptomyces sp. NPDC059071]|uniref:hypothetical protein n=1 Tax=unclassified Streptomyces TaxID=2593676 RepID=UPI0036598665
MAESVQVRCPECLRTLRYAAPAFPCSCGIPVAPPVIPGAAAVPVTHRNWSDEWVTVHCPACARASDWPHPEVGCPCGAVLRVAVSPAGSAPGLPTTTPSAAPTTGGAAGKGGDGSGASAPEACVPAPRTPAAPGASGGSGASGGPAGPAGPPAAAQRPAGPAEERPCQGRPSAADASTTGPTAAAGTTAAGPGGGTATESGTAPANGSGTGTGAGPAGLAPSAAPGEHAPGEHAPGAPGSVPAPGPAHAPAHPPASAPAESSSFARRHPSPPVPPASAHARPGPEAARAAFRPVTIRTARDAVAASAGYLRWLGFRDVVQPEERSASAVDLRGPGLVAQVDPSTRPTGLRAVECLWLNGLSSSSVSVYFSLAGYTPEAHERADGLGIPLFVLDLTGTPQPVNPPAGELLSSGAP